jgi:hypothetical protein
MYVLGLLHDSINRQEKVNWCLDKKIKMWYMIKKIRKWYHIWKDNFFSMKIKNNCKKYTIMKNIL